MGVINVGATIKIPCDVRPGPFSDERLISFETVDGIISGFVEEDALLFESGHFFVSGIVIDVQQDRIVVVVRGSFFQTNGIAAVSRTVACASN